MPRLPFTIDNKFLEELREAVLHYARSHFGSSGLPLEDLTQEALLTTFENVHNGILTTLTSNLTTYVTGIFKIKAKEKLRDQSKIRTVPNQSGQNVDDVLDPVDIGTAQVAIDRWLDKDYREEQEELKNAMYDLVTNMTEPCKTILWSFYWENQSMREIADAMNYANARVATTQKSRCLTKVRIAMEEIINTNRS